MSTGLLLIPIHIFLSIIPGLGWAITLNYRNLYLPSFAISMLIPVLTAVFAKAVGLSFSNALIIWALIAIIGWGGAFIRPPSLKPFSTFAPFIIISILWGIYCLIAGAYTDVPADFIFHTRFIEANLEAMAQNGFTEAHSLLHKFNYYGHYLWAVELHFLGLEAWHAYEALAYVNALIFFFGIYSAGVVIFENEISTENSAKVLAFCACVAALILFNVDAFLFARYYFIAPVIHTFIGFIVAGLLGTTLIRGEGHIIRDSVLIILISFWLLLAHQQELLFLIIMLFLVLLIETLRASPNTSRKLYLLGLSICAISLAIVLWSFFYLYVPRNPIDGNKVIELGRIVPFVQNLYIANPLYQFYQVMGVAGITTLVILWVLRQDWWQNSWLLAALISPIATLFNPIFVDFFLRQAGSDVLWRMAFLTQLYYLFVLGVFLLIKRIISANYSIIKRITTALALVFLLFTLFPSEGRYWNFGPNRLLGLTSLPTENTPKHWDDLWLWLDSQPSKVVLTDPYTGYQLASFTEHDYRGYKFFNAMGYRKYRFENYEDSPLKKYNGAWLVINLRDGGHSLFGEKVRHWHADSLKVSNWYPQTLLDHIENNPDKFAFVWQSNDSKISIYQLKF